MVVLATRLRLVTQSFFFRVHVVFHSYINKNNSSLEKSISVLLMTLG